MQSPLYKHQGNLMQRGQRLKLYAISLVTVFISVVAILSAIALNQIKQTTLSQISDTLQALLHTVQESHHILVEQRMLSIESIADAKQVVQLVEQLLHQ